MSNSTLRQRLGPIIERFVPPQFTAMNTQAVGIVAIALIVAACVAAFGIGSLGLLEDRYEVSAVMPEAAGLKKGSLVRVAGVDVGEVTGIDADHDLGQVVVTFEVDKGIELGEETNVEVALATLLGGEYIRLTGPVQEPLLEDLPEEDRRIPLDRVSIPFSVNRAFNEATETVDALDTETVNELVGEFADITTDSGPRVQRVLDGLERVARAFNEREEVIGSLLDNSEQLTQTLADKDETLVRLIDSSEVVLSQIASRRDELAAVLGDGSDVVQTLANILTEKRSELDKILNDLDIATDAVARQQDNVDTILSWAGPTFEQVSKIASHGPYIDVLPVALGPDVVGVLAALYPELGLSGGGSPAASGGGGGSGGGTGLPAGIDGVVNGGGG